MFFQIQRNCAEFLLRIPHGACFRKSTRCFSARAVHGGPTERSVFMSQSTDINFNLALEDWLYRHEDFQTHRILLLWQNTETVVIGRHQNIWAEVDVEEAGRRQVRVARRNSGGGAVYHDQGNLNCSFLTTRTDYNRRFNLAIIQTALRKLGLVVQMNCKDDLILNGSKISGTASKLGKNAYHHCTLLVDSNLQTLSTLLNPNTDGIVSRATQSKKSPVTNLIGTKPDIKISQILSAIGQEFLQTDSSGVDGGVLEANRQRGFQLVNPTDEWFPGLEGIRNHFSSWEWTFAKTPEFTVTRRVEFGSGNGECQIELKIVKGLIQSPVSVTFSLEVHPKVQAQLSSFLETTVEGKSFSPHLLEIVERWRSVGESYQNHQHR